MNVGGAETFLMKIYRQIDKTKYQFDFCINVKNKSFYEDEISKMGGIIYRIPSKSENVKEFKKQLAKIVSKGKYEYVMRITSSGAGLMDLKIAKRAGARVCIARSSNASDGKGFIPYFAHRIGKLLYGKYADVKIAPSDLAAIYTFGNNAYKSGAVNILNNAVDINVFHYDEGGRNRIRTEFGISENVKLFGHIGRFMEQKNHVFLLKIFKSIIRENPEAMLMLVGIGPLEEKIKGQIAELELEDKVIFTGVRTDIPQILSAMDAFILPSLYEGMPNTVIEAQACALPCVISDTITTEADITGLVKYASLEASPEFWAKEVIACACKARTDTKQLFIKNKYDIESVTESFATLVFEAD